MAFPTDLSDVVAGGTITASRNNAITAKIGIDDSDVSSSLDYLIKNTSSRLGKIASLTVGNNYIVGSGGFAGNWTVKSPSSVVTDLGLVIGTDVQEYSATLTSLSNPSPSAIDKYLTFVGSNYDAVTTAEVRADIFDLGSDATGDVFYRNSSGILTRLGVGSATQVLTLAGSPAIPTWAAAGGGSSAFTEAVTIDLSTGVGLTIDQTGSGDIFDLQDGGSSVFNVDQYGRVAITSSENTSNTSFLINPIRASGGDNIWALEVKENNTSLFQVGVAGNHQLRSKVTHYFSSIIGDQAATVWQMANSGAGSGNLSMWKSPASSAISWGLVNGTDTRINLGGTAQSSKLIVSGGNLEDATGDEVLFDFSGQVEKATSGNYTGIKLNVTEVVGKTYAGNLLLDLQVDGSTVFNISDTGEFAINSATTALTINQSGAGNILDLEDDGTSRLAITHEGHLELDVIEAVDDVYAIDFNVVRKAANTPKFFRVRESGTDVLTCGIASGEFATTMAHVVAGGFECSGAFTLRAGAPKIYFQGTSDNNITINDSTGDQNFTFKTIESQLGYVFQGGRKAASGNEIFMSLVPTVNKDAGDFTGILSNVTLTGDGFGTGTGLLLDLQVGGTSKFRVDETGTPIVPLQTPSSASDTGTVGMIKWDAGYIYVCTATDTWERVAVATW